MSRQALLSSFFQFVPIQLSRPCRHPSIRTLCERYSLGARWVFSFSRCCYLIVVLSSHRFCGSWAPGLSRSHLDSAVELSCPDRNTLGQGAHRFLAIAQFFVYLSATMGSAPLVAVLRLAATDRSSPSPL